MEHGFNGIFLVASNPVDILSYATWKFSGMDSSRVIGSGTILDTARFRYSLGRYFDLAPTSVHAYVIGEHGDTELPVLSAGSVAGTSIQHRLEMMGESAGEDVDEIFVKTRDAAYEIIQAKGSTSFGIGMGLARITQAVFSNQDVVLPISTLLEGEYGFEDIYIGTPAVINRQGVRHAVELQLDAEEKKKFDHSATVLRKVMAEAGLVK